MATGMADARPHANIIALPRLHKPNSAGAIISPLSFEKPKTATELDRLAYPYATADTRPRVPGMNREWLAGNAATLPDTPCAVARGPQSVAGPVRVLEIALAVEMEIPLLP